MRSSGAQELGKLPANFSSQDNNNALTDYCNFVCGSSQIDLTLDKNVREASVETQKVKMFNNTVVKILFDMIRTLGRQCLAFRGSGNDINGNFRQVVLLLLARHNPILNKWLDNKNQKSYHVTYLSPDSQNELIDLLGAVIRNSIIKEINESSFYTVMADTTPDLSRRDQMSIIIRFVKYISVCSE